MKFECDKCGEVDVCKIHGYSFGDQLLEGIMFTVHADGKVETDPKDAKYLGKLNLKKWKKEALEFVRGTDIVECVTCGDDMGVIDGEAAPSNFDPKPIKAKSWDEVVESLHEKEEGDG